MSQNLVRRRSPVRAAFAAALVFSLALQFTPPAGAQGEPRRAADTPLKAAFVYVSPVGDAGWTYQHDLGRRAMQEALGPRVQVSVVESVAEGPDSERVMRDLAQQGHELVFATSFGYLEPALRVAGQFPKVKFEHAGGYKTAPNLRPYNARYYEGRYLAGLVAGAASRTGIAGYVAGFPVPEVIQGINAFTLGMREARPDARVRVLWLDTWFDPAREREAAMALADQGADVLTHHSASAAVPLAAEARGIRAISYHSDMRKLAPRAQLTAVMHEWGAHYTHAARSVIDGTWTPQPVSGGIREGMIRLAPFGPGVAKASADAVRRREAEIAEGRFTPFSGRLVDTAGRQRHAGGAMSEQAIASMNWFVQGVEGALPKP
jgi:simple sugar transport system substrate-binding protein